ncbi:MAG: hypothetical protein R2695_06555 [Acidimicrobiales bacterium]
MGSWRPPPQAAAGGERPRSDDRRPAGRDQDVVREVAEADVDARRRFGTIGCTVDGQVYEITTHRAESYDAESRKPSVVFGDRIDDDLARRDFTVSAMALDLADGRLVDPHGGLDDLAAGVLRTPSTPTPTFSEDPLRMLRRPLPQRVRARPDRRVGAGARTTR